MLGLRNLLFGSYAAPEPVDEPEAPRCHYFPADDPDAPEIQAAVADGIVQPWRVDGEGRQWFRRLPMIRGIDG